MHANHVQKTEDSSKEEENFLKIEIISSVSIILFYKKIPDTLTNYFLALQ